MSKYGEYLKDRKEKDLEFFFGETKSRTNKYFTFNRIKNENEIVILTNNIKTVKGSPVLIVGSNKAVFLKDWAVRKVHNYEHGINTYAVKLNRNYFKTYTFTNAFEGYEDMGEDDFNSLYKVAEDQNKVNLEIAEGFMK